MSAKKIPNSLADSTVPETVVPGTLTHTSVILALRSRRLSEPLRLITKPLILDSYATSQYSFPSRRSSHRVRRWSSLENSPPPVTACISLYCWLCKFNELAQKNLVHFLQFTDVSLEVLLVRRARGCFFDRLDTIRVAAALSNTCC